MRKSFSSHGFDQLSYTPHVHQADHARAIRPAGWLASSLLVGIPALTFAFLFHWAGPSLVRQMSSWWRIFHLLLIRKRQSKHTVERLNPQPASLRHFTSKFSGIGTLIVANVR